uniref:Uncharacterized protein n=1 Tax=Arundo donax TaxID=35708 RepID=A0A0A9AKV4_ARUDO
MLMAREHASSGMRIRHSSAPTLPSFRKAISKQIII